MFLSVITAEHSSFGLDGLTYFSDQPIETGSLVVVPLRKHEVEGIVIAAQKEKPETSFEVKSIIRVIGRKPLLPPPLLKTFHWLRGYYCSSARQAMQVFLPAPPWHLLTEAEPEPVYRLAKQDITLRGKKQMAIVDFLKSREAAKRNEILENTGASTTTLKSLFEQAIIVEEKPLPSVALTPTLTPTLTKPTLSLDNRPDIDRFTDYSRFAGDCLKNNQSSLILFPNIFAATDAHRTIVDLHGSSNSIHLLHSSTRVSTRREIYRKANAGERMIIVGTRTALFTPLPSLGLIIMDGEHEWTWKSDQTPKYHTRLTAEILAKQSGATLILSSPTPSLDSLRHALGDEKTTRYKLIGSNDFQPFDSRSCDPGSQTAAIAAEPPGRGVPAAEKIRRTRNDQSQYRVQLIDLATAQFGKHYPFTNPLVDAVHERLDRKEASVLFLNRRGTATSLLCMDCRETTLSAATNLPLRVITRNGKPWLADEAAGEILPVPETCHKCGSAGLQAVGAGTERVEADARILFPKARIARADADTLNEPGAMEELLKRLSAGEIDILLGTLPVLRAISSPRVTLAAILIADVGLSVPDFRAGERVFSIVSSIVQSMKRKPSGAAIVQSYRPQAPEIRCAVTGNEQEYWEAELKLRKEAGYPPFTQIIDLIVRNDRAKAKSLRERAAGLAKEAGVRVHWREEMRGGLSTFIVTLRGEHPRMILSQLPLKGVSVDVDPVE